MAKYRRSFDIIAGIVRAVAKGATRKTRIMYDANLSYRLLDKYLKRTIELGFIRFNNNYYEVTDKGRMFLDMYVKFSNKYSNLQREVENMMLEMETLKKMCTTDRESKRKPNTRRNRFKRSSDV
ncbi:MAG: winged helix-turn-helix domain-containing protein [Candidatus Bathyarchaeia archaeon]